MSRRDLDAAEARIAEQERELARVQTQETIGSELDANLTREALKQALHVATVFAAIVHGFISEISIGFDQSVDRMAQDLNNSKPDDDAR